METMVANLMVDQQEMQLHYDERINHHSGRLERQREDIEKGREAVGKLVSNQDEIVEECRTLRTQVESVGDQICQCGAQSQQWKGKGMAVEPLEYTAEWEAGELPETFPFAV